MSGFKTLDELTLADDFMFCIVMSRPDTAKQFLELLYSKTIESIQSSQKQAVAENMSDKHGSRF